MSTTADYPHRYTAELAGQIEEKWQKAWDEAGVFEAGNPTGTLAESDLPADKYFVLDMFPYPSGKGLHVGHPFGYIATDTMARYHRMRGKNVLYTMGFDSFGLPAEQYAIQTGQHPRITTETNIATMREQLRRIGFSYDKRRSVATTDLEFVKWTQWIFLQIYNAWYDETAPGRREGTVGRARPISELVEEFEKGLRPTPSTPWAEMSAVERAELLDSYRLAYSASAPVNWCPGLGTVLANEEVTNEGRSERGNFPVFKRRLRQWMMRITAYAERLAADLDMVDWPEKVISMQRNWIGRSEGAHVTFTAEHENGSEDLVVFTTRPDTLFGATFMVVSPEHPMLAAENLPQEWPTGGCGCSCSELPGVWTGGAATPREAVAAYQAAAAAMTDTDRADADRTKTGVFTGLYAVNPVNHSRIPIFTADYVMMGYGTGAIMAVPAHDERDFEFATRFELPIIQTIAADAEFDGTSAWTGDGEIINSANDSISLNGLDKAAGKAAITAWLEERGLGEAAVNYRLRDWLFSRQRYWGEPFPIVYDEDGVAHALPESMLPLNLPETNDFSPRSFDADDAESNPEPPLGRLTDWVNVELDLGDGPRRYTRETNTMPNWAGSCWYEIRYIDPDNNEAFVDPANEEYWLGPRPEQGNVSGGTDLYVGGVEHAVLHLLYARFWHKVLFDLGHLSSCEPFHKLFNQGYILAYAYKDSRGQYVPADEVVEVLDESGEVAWEWNGQRVTQEYGKMGKSLKNIVTPDDMCTNWGADTFRLFEMSMGPLDISRPWDESTVVGAMRYLQRLWRNAVDEQSGEIVVVDTPLDDATARLQARTVAEVTEEYENMRINTAIARMIVFNNHLTAMNGGAPREAVETLIKLTAPVAPHIAEELWHRLGHETTIVREAFPVVTDERLLEEEAVPCAVQVKGKVRDVLQVPPSISEADLQALALASPKVAKYLDGEPRKVIVKAPKIVNIVP